jgi:hypothetical protein
MRVETTSEILAPKPATRTRADPYSELRVGTPGPLVAEDRPPMPAVMPGNPRAWGGRSIRWQELPPYAWVGDASAVSSILNLSPGQGRQKIDAM